MEIPAVLYRAREQKVSAVGPLLSIASYLPRWPMKATLGSLYLRSFFRFLKKKGSVNCSRKAEPGKIFYGKVKS